MGKVLFEDRFDAGRKLAGLLRRKDHRFKDPIVLGIPRGGIPVGAVVAGELGCELDTIVLRKISIPQDPEAGFGAVTLDKTVILNQELLEYVKITKEQMDKEIEEVYQEVLRRDAVYRGKKPFPDLKDRSVILIDDGLASGYTMLAAVKFCGNKNPERIVVAVPVASDSAAELIGKEVDEFVVLHTSHSFYFAVASFYENFEDMEDKEIVEILKKSKKDKGRSH
jgi:putative phosphoribosyl transferase